MQNDLYSSLFVMCDCPRKPTNEKNPIYALAASDFAIVNYVERRKNATIYDFLACTKKVHFFLLAGAK